MANSTKNGGFTMKANLNRQILLIDILVILLIIIVVILPSSFLRMILGLPLVIFFPGYALTAAIFPRRDSLKYLERVGIGFGLSLAVSAIFGLILNYTPWGISIYPVLICLSLFTILTSVIALYRRRNLPEEDRLNISVIAGWHAWLKKGAIDKTLSVTLTVAVLGAIGAITYAVTNPTEERFTEFYVLGPEGKVEGYPEDLRVGQEANVIIVVVNHEYEETNYELDVAIDGVSLNEPIHITLQHGEKWEQEVPFAPLESGQQKVEFQLYKDGELYRQLYLSIDVRQR